jgi:hypothetical protein
MPFKALERLFIRTHFESVLTEVIGEELQISPHRAVAAPEPICSKGGSYPQSLLQGFSRPILQSPQGLLLRFYPYLRLFSLARPLKAFKGGEHAVR